MHCWLTLPDLAYALPGVTLARRWIQRFEVLDQLGGGGTGQVYRARDSQLDRDVAIRCFMSPPLLGKPGVARQQPGPQPPPPSQSSSR